MSICQSIAPHGPKLYPVDHHADRLYCCMGAVMNGPRGCACWEPIYDLEQVEPRLDARPETRSRMCGDCAYRPDSPERADDPYALLDLDNFWCHRGIRRPKAWRHPDGRVRTGFPADYMPPIVAGVPFRADGRPAARCGGWAAEQVAS